MGYLSELGPGAITSASDRRRAGTYSDAAGAGGLASLSFFDRHVANPRIPIMGKASGRLKKHVRRAGETYNIELCAIVATARMLKVALVGREVITFVDNGAIFNCLARRTITCDTVPFLLLGLWPNSVKDDESP